jgi:serine protease Do
MKEIKKVRGFAGVWRLPGKAVIPFLVLAWLFSLGPMGCVQRESESAKSAQAGKAKKEAPARTSMESKSADDLSTAIIRVARQTMPAVAHIEVTERQEVTNPMLPFEADPFLRHFFGLPKMPRKFKRELKGLGSGMIIDAQGHILTNHHVAGGATKIEVQLSNGDRYSAKLVGTDPKTDLAVIQISTKKSLPSVTFADSDKVEVGQWVVAIGAPRGLDKTVTQGIISAKHRRGITDPSSYQDFLQTDAPINPGNSGGPLLNLQGEVIGVNAAIISESGGFEGIGFTIPSNMAQHVAKALIAHGKVERGWLGLGIRDLTPDQAKSLHLENSKGALVGDVIPGGPAAKAGLKENDVVVGYRGKEIPDSGTFRNRVADTPIGQEAKLTVWRDGKKVELTVKVGSLKNSTKILAVYAKSRLGAEIRNISPQEGEKWGLHQGVVITALEAKSPLRKAGFEVGDVILGINGQPIKGMEAFVQIVSTLKPHQQVTIMAMDHHSGGVGKVQVVTN